MTSTRTIILKAFHSVFKTQLQQSAASVAISAIFAGAGVLLGVMALGTLAFATYMELYQGMLLSSQAAALWVAIGLALIATTFLACAVHCLRDIQHRKQTDIQALLESLSDDAVEQAVKMLEEPVTANPMTSMAIAAIAGFMAGRKL